MCVSVWVCVCWEVNPTGQNSAQVSKVHTQVTHRQGLRKIACCVDDWVMLAAIQTWGPNES